MKKLIAIMLTLILAISMLTACGGGSKPSNGNSSGNSSNTPPASTNSGGNSGGGSNANTPAQQNTEIIKSSELITLEDAARITGVDMIVKKIDKVETMSPGEVKTQYDTDSMLFFTIDLYQDAAYDLSNSTHKSLLDSGGAKSYGETLRVAYENNPLEIKAYKDTLPIEGIGDWAYIWGSSKDSISIAYGDYFIIITIYSTPKGSGFSDEEKIEWHIEKLTEAGKLAVERLEALIK